MGKMSKIGKMCLLTLAFSVMMSTTCFADVVFSPIAKYSRYLPYFNILIIIFAVLLVISLICAVVGKVGHMDELMESSLVKSEQFFYYLLISILAGVTYGAATIFLYFAIVPFAGFVASLFYRYSMKNKAASYGILIFVGAVIAFLIFV